MNNFEIHIEICIHLFCTAKYSSGGQRLKLHFMKELSYKVLSR